MTPSRNSAGLAYARAFVQTDSGRTALVVFGCLVLAGILSLTGVAEPWSWLPLAASGLLVGFPLAVAIVRDALRRTMGADLLALIAIVAGAALQEWFVVGVIALMVSGGAALESAATLRASQILDALAKRSPTIAHRLRTDGSLEDVPVADVLVNDVVVVLPHEICPVDGVVVQGTGPRRGRR